MRMVTMKTVQTYAALMRVLFFLGGVCARVIHWHKGYPKGSAGMRFVQRLATPAFAPNSCLRETLPRALALGPSSFLRGKR